MASREGDWEHYPRKFGKYHLLAPLAQGGMGALYLAVAGDRGLERMMVIKTVLPHLADAEYVARFRDEAKVVVKLSHGNLIPVFDAGQVEGELFLAMDFVEGRDLRRTLRASLEQKREAGAVGRVVPGESWSIFDETARSLLESFPELRNDADIERGNAGITLVEVL